MTNTTLDTPLMDASASDMPIDMQARPAERASESGQPMRRSRTLALGTPEELTDARTRGPRRAVLMRLVLASVVVAIALMVFIPTVSRAADIINVNKADMAALQTLPDIGEKRAKAIMSYRSKNGGFGAKSDLLNVPGIGDKILKKISARISTSGGVSKVKSDKSKSKDSSKDAKKSTSKSSKDSKDKKATKAKKDSKKDGKKSSSKKAKSDDGKSKSKSSKKEKKKDKKKSKSSDKKKKKTKKKKSS